MSRPCDAGATDDLPQQTSALSALLTAHTESRILSEAAVSQARRNAQARVRFLRDYDVLTSAQIADLAGSALAHDWRTARHAVAVQHNGQSLFPRFQFDHETWRPLPVIAEVIRSFHDRDASDWQIVLWLANPCPWLRAVPADLLRDQPAKVIQAVQRTFDPPW